jgi:UTP--glucose-1-phosphate uridylyltransferase
MTKPIRKAILPVAGLGTRFLPATKAVPKEMLTIVDRPIIQYVVDEARAAGIEHIVFVTGRNKQVIEDHFDVAYELEDTLKARNKTAALDLLEKHRPTTRFNQLYAPASPARAWPCHLVRTRHHRRRTFCHSFAGRDYQVESQLPETDGRPL